MEFLITVLAVPVIIWVAVLNVKINNQNKLIYRLREEIMRLYVDYRRNSDKSSSYRYSNYEEYREYSQNYTARNSAPNDGYSDAPDSVRKDEQNPAIVDNSAPAHVTNSTIQKTNEPIDSTIKKDEFSYTTSTFNHSTAKKENTSLENWLGRNVLGIAASVLIFIGLIFFGILVYEYLTEVLKVIIMYSISILITATGIFLTIKKRSSFSAILTGCGCGSMFISIFLTHTYFGYINDITSLALLLLWMGLTLYLAKKTDSLSVSIITHIGMMFSSCFSLITSHTDEMLVLALAYQAASVAIIVIGNILCFKKTYKLGLIMSLMLCVFASLVLAFRFFMNTHVSITVFFPDTSIPAAVIISTFLLQFFCASFLSYLLSVSSSRLRNENGAIILHIANKILWLAALFINVTYISYRLLLFYYGYNELHIYKIILAAVVISFAVLLIHSAISVLMKIKLGFKANLESISVTFMSIASGVLFFVLWNVGRTSPDIFHPLTGFILLGVLLIITVKLSRNNTYLIAGSIFLSLDLLFMIFGGYKQLGDHFSIAMPLGYLVLYLLIIWGGQFLLKPEKLPTASSTVRILSFIITEISLISIFMRSSLQYKGTILLLILTVIHCLLYLFKYDRDYENKYEMTSLQRILWLNELVLIAINSYFISFVPKNNTMSILSYFIIISTFYLAFLRIEPIIKGEGSPLHEFLTGLKVTLLTLAVVKGNTNWFDQAYVLSLICMFTALLCIIAGFIFKAKTLRLYGLITTLVCVLKLVTFDVAELNTIFRVVSFIAGGVICFIISALYNYSAKRITSPTKNNYTR